MDLTVRPLTAESWPALEELFGRSGASNGCWCMYWRIGPAYARRARDENRAALHALAVSGPPPGLIAFEGDRPVGWCEILPRDALPWLRARMGRHAPGAGVWSLGCFYVRRSHRRRGVMTALIAAAVEAARHGGAAVVEAYPIDTAAPGSSSNLFTGSADAFRRAGFVKVAERSPARPVMRLDLGRPAGTPA